jgi:ABC-type sugar transport system substrate-binding protein
MTAQHVRVDRCVELLQENYADRITVLDKQYCDWDTQKGMECMENWFQKYGNDMNCLIGAGAMMAVGASQALVAAGQNMDDWLITSYDATDDVLYAINHGENDMTVGIDASEIGKQAADVARRIATGEFKEKLYECNADILATIDTTNIADWYKGK